MDTKPSRKRLIQGLKSFSESANGVPTVRGMRNTGPYSPYYYKEEFGSWHEALRAADIQPTHGVDRDVNREILLEELQRIDEKTDRPPRRTDVDEHGQYPYTLYDDEFVSFVRALEEAGIDPDEKQYRFSSVETPAEKQGSANIETLRANGPTPGSGLPNGLSTKDRELGAWKFDMNSGSTQPSDPIYYLDGEHAPELVIRRFFQQNPHVLEYRNTHGVKMEIKNHRPSWTEIGREIVDELVDSGVGSTSSFENLVVIRVYENEEYQYCFNCSVSTVVDTDELPISVDDGADQRPVWGFSRENEEIWNTLSECDGLLFSTQPGVFTHYVPVAEAVEDSDVMTTLWVEYENGVRRGGIETPWPYIIVGTEVQQIDLQERELTDELDGTLDGAAIQSLGDDAVDPLVTNYGGMESFLREQSRSTDPAAESESDEDGSADEEPNNVHVRKDSAPTSVSGDSTAKQPEQSNAATEFDTQSETDSSDEPEHRESATTERKTIAVSPAIGLIVERAASDDSRFANDPAAIVDTAVESFLAETVGSKLDPDLFTRNEQWNLSIECNSLIQRLLESTVTADDSFDTAEDVVEAALSEYFGLQEESIRLPLNEFNRYQILIDSLIANEDYPCETVDEIVEVALEVHLLGKSESSVE